MKCCGVNDFTDWYPVLGENTVPDRCCTENSQDCGRNSTELVWKTVRLALLSQGSGKGGKEENRRNARERKMWPWDFNFHLSSFQGCYERVMTWFDENKHVLGSIGMCILIMQVILVWYLSPWLWFAVSILDSAVWKVVLNPFKFDHDFKNVRFVLRIHLRPSVVSPAKKTWYSGVLLTCVLTSEHHFGVPMFSHLLPCPLGNFF